MASREKKEGRAVVGRGRNRGLMQYYPNHACVCVCLCVFSSDYGNVAQKYLLIIYKILVALCLEHNSCSKGCRRGGSAGRATNLVY